MATRETPDLVVIEKRLKAEAAAYLEQSDTLAPSYRWMENQVLRFTGNRLQEIGAVGALDRLGKLLQSQTRWSRSRHPAYDINRHIALKQLCKAIKTDNGDSESKRPKAACIKKLPAEDQ